MVEDLSGRSTIARPVAEAATRNLSDCECRCGCRIKMLEHQVRKLMAWIEGYEQEIAAQAQLWAATFDGRQASPKQNERIARAASAVALTSMLRSIKD